MSAKRLQVRACSICNKVGHNRSRCPNGASRPADQQSPQKTNYANPKPAMNFFVHHVNESAPQSPHVLDLKKPKQDILEKIQSIAPSDSDLSLFYHYHNQPTTKTTEIETEHSPSPKPNKPLFAPLNPATDTSPLSQHNFILASKSSQLADWFKHDFANWPKKLSTKIKNQRNNLQKQLTNLITQRLPWKQLAFSAAALLVILIVPLQANTYYQKTRLAVGDISSNSTAGFMALQESTVSLMHGDVNTAGHTIDTALNRFNSAISTMDAQSQFLQTIVSVVPVLNDAVSGRQKLLLAGQEISLGNSYLIKGINESKNASTTMTERLNIISGYLKSALPNYEQANKNLSDVKPEILPLAYQAPFGEFKKIFTGLTTDLRTIAGLSDTLQEIFGGKGFRRYLLVFQNPAELRPTGGFIGSFAILDIRDGKITNLEIPPGGPYDLQGQLSENVEPPTPLLLLRPRWEFQDANWFPDFPQSAQKIMRFYRKSRGVSADGVIAINSTVLERLLAIMGPIQDDKRGLIVSSTNAIDTIQTVVESQAERNTNKPKQIIADLAPQFLDYLKNIPTTNLLPLLTNLEEALAQKEIQAYFTNEDTEQQLKSFDWAGAITPTTNQDYLMVVNANIQGQKSDARIQQTITHQAAIEADGTITDTVIITRAHKGNADEGMYGVHNIDYIRLYAPAGSTLLEASGFTWPPEDNFKTPLNSTKKDEDLNRTEQEVLIEKNSGTRIVNEFGKTSFGNWIITEPGQTTQVQFVYRLPFKATQEDLSRNWANLILASNQNTLGYQLVLQRQSGCDSQFESQIILPDNIRAHWTSGKQITTVNNGVVISAQPLLQDQIWSLMAK